MNLTRNLKAGMSGEDVRTVKDKLFELGFYTKSVKKITHDRFGSDTEDAVRAFQRAKGLDDDGIVGELTWSALFPTESLTRVLKQKMSGEDVRRVKDMLFELDCYPIGTEKITNDVFGKNTEIAVRCFQEQYNLNVDGIVGEKTWEKLHAVFAGRNETTVEYITEAEYPRISAGNRAKINAALNSATVTKLRREIVLEVLKYATDASIASRFKYPSSLYIRGGNLYNKDLMLNVISDEYLAKTYSKKYASYCTSGRLSMMRKAVEANPFITGADCSGGVIGIWRMFGLIGKTTDATANGLLGSGYSIAIKKEELTAADLIGKSGHICLYVGGGLMVEWAGGEYGCQLTEVSNRRCWSFTKQKMVKMAACTKYRRPKVW